MRSLIAIAVALSIFPPAFATQRQGLFNRNRQVSKQVVVQKVVAQPVRVQRVVVGHHAVQQVRVQRVIAQPIVVQQVGSGHCSGVVDNAGVLQLNSGCSALYR